MGRVSQETTEKLKAFVESLPAGDAKKKCAVCNEALTHIVKQAEAQTGAPTLTVCRAIADEINDGAAPADVVTGEQLQDRVRNKTTDRNLSWRNAKINDLEKPAQVTVNRETGEVYVDGKKSGLPPEYTTALFFAKTAVNHLKSIAADDPQRIEALDWVIDWCEQQKQQLG